MPSPESATRDSPRTRWRGRALPRMGRAQCGERRLHPRLQIGLRPEPSRFADADADLRGLELEHRERGAYVILVRELDPGPRLSTSDRMLPAPRGHARRSEMLFGCELVVCATEEAQVLERRLPAP